MITSIRKPAVAGQFYSEDASKLSWEVQGYIKDSGVEPAPDRVKALIAPHAGYMFSGPTAGFAYARIKGKQIKRCILLGCSHKYQIDRACIFDAGAFETPNGTFPIDEEFAAKLHDIAGSSETQSGEPHMREHCLEVQLPFLQVAVGVVPIVPILFSSPCAQWHLLFGKTMAEMTDENDLVIASTDLSHYLTQQEATEIDKHTTDVILSQDCAAVSTDLNNGRISMCGGAAVAVAMAYALEVSALSWSLLDYRTSGDISGDYSRVVGYGAISMETDS